MQYPNGDLYIGEWNQGNKFGIGQFTWKETGTVYEGFFDNDDLHGKGTMYYLNGDAYTSVWDEGTAIAKGKYICQETGRIYEGRLKSKTDPDFQMNKCSGFKDLQGNGKIIDDQTGVYEGSIKNGLKSGLGSMRYPNGHYLGIWDNDKQHGYGTLTWKEGNITHTQKGNFMNGIYIGNQ